MHGGIWTELELASCKEAYIALLLICLTGRSRMMSQTFALNETRDIFEVTDSPRNQTCFAFLFLLFSFRRNWLFVGKYLERSSHGRYHPDISLELLRKATEILSIDAVSLWLGPR